MQKFQDRSVRLERRATPAPRAPPTPSSQRREPGLASRARRGPQLTAWTEPPPSKFAVSPALTVAWLQNRRIARCALLDAQLDISVVFVVLVSWGEHQSKAPFDLSGLATWVAMGWNTQKTGSWLTWIVPQQPINETGCCLGCSGSIAATRVGKSNRRNWCLRDAGQTGCHS